MFQGSYPETFQHEQGKGCEQRQDGKLDMFEFCLAFKHSLEVGGLSQAGCNPRLFN